MSEAEWRKFGVKQSPGWVHYMIHSLVFVNVDPEPHILMFRREKDYQIKYPNGKPGMGGMCA
jgi:cyclin-dependent kinase regulatory subunit CKS1